MSCGFRDMKQITTVTELEELMGVPSALAIHKVIHEVDVHIRDFIKKSPLLFLGTANRAGDCDVSPRGDSPGFVQIVDGNHLVIPERPGNRRMDSMRNILETGKISVIFIIPGVEETLRVHGCAVLLRDEELLRGLQANGKTPKIAIGVEVKECYLHCAKSMKRSAVWNPETWLLDAERPRASTMFSHHAKTLGLSVEEIEQSLAVSYRDRLY